MLKMGGERSARLCARPNGHRQLLAHDAPLPGCGPRAASGRGGGDAGHLAAVKTFLEHPLEDGGRLSATGEHPLLPDPLPEAMERPQVGMGREQVPAPVMAEEDPGYLPGIVRARVGFPGGVVLPPEGNGEIGTVG